MPRRKRRSRSRQPAAGAPGWVWMLFGLAIGLTVAFAIYVRDDGRVAQPAPAPQAASVVEDERERPPADAAPPKSKYDFYDLLPNFEVIVPEEDLEARLVVPSETPTRAGTYELQTGSFNAFEDADRMRARLALLGIESRVQRVSIDARTYHRVRIGPHDDLARVNALLDRLDEAGIVAITIRTGD